MPLSNPSSGAIKSGTYTGDGSTSRTIDIGAVPYLVLIYGVRGAVTGMWIAYMDGTQDWAMWQTGATIGAEGANSMSQASTGFIVGVGHADFANVNAATYRYVAFVG